jgi:ribosome maturation factor RimP
MAADTEKVREIAERVAAGLGLEVVDVEYRGGAGKQGRMLRITIDRPDAPAVGGENGIGVTHEDCANLSREVSTILDVEDIVPGIEYVLEVSSPGLDRRLSRPKDFERFIGSRLKLMTREPVGVTEKSKGNRHFEGRLEEFRGGRLVVDVAVPKRGQKAKPGHKMPPPQRVEIELDNVERANLVPEI